MSQFPMTEMDSEAKALRNKDRIILNVGGVRHETFKSTLRNFPDTRLAWITGSDYFADYDPEKNEYFFDRHPGVFQQIMNFYRTGKLHCPSDVCGPLFEEELNFWGIDEKQMESCCWSTYTLHREAQENLKVFGGPDFFEDDAEGSAEDEWEAASGDPRRTSNSTSSWQAWRGKIWSVIDDHTSSNLAKVYIWVSLAFVVISVISLCASSDEKIGQENLTIRIIDIVCGIWFTAEFLLRCITCPDFLAFARQLLNWVDFVAVIPFYVTLIFGHGIVTEVLVLVRMLRLFRFFKMSLGLQILKHTLVASSKEVLLLLLLVLIPVLIFAGILHLCEKGVTSTKFKSIPEAFWWAIITVTTVGYGDMAPLTTQGKIFGAICAAVSLLVSAFPISIIGSNFSLYYRHAQAKLKLPKKPRRVLIGAPNSLLRDDREAEKSDEQESCEEMKNSVDLTSEVYLGPKRPRRQRMSLFTNGVIPQRHSRVRSLSNECLPEQQNTDNDRKEVMDNHNSSLLSTSTRSTAIDSPPPRSISFPANLPDIADKCAVASTPGAVDNPAFNIEFVESDRDNEGVKRNNGAIQSLKTPRVTITTDENKECTPVNEQWTNNEIQDMHNTHIILSPDRNDTDLAPVDG